MHGMLGTQPFVAPGILTGMLFMFFLVVPFFRGLDHRSTGAVMLATDSNDTISIAEACGTVPVLFTSG